MTTVLGSSLPALTRLSGSQDAYQVSTFDRWIGLRALNRLITNRATIALLAEAIVLLGDQHHSHGGVVVKQVEEMQAV